MLFIDITPSHILARARFPALAALGVLLFACGGDGPSGPAVGPPVRAVFTSQPGDTTAGTTINPAVEVQIRDEAGNLVESATDPVTVELLAGTEQSRLLGTTTVEATNGVATFDDLRIETASVYRLRAVSGQLEPGVSDWFRISAAAPTRLGFLTPPSAVEGWEPFDPAVRVAVQDEFGNTVTGSSAAVSVALAVNPTGAHLLGTRTVEARNGVATFDDLGIARPAEGYSLRASASGLTDVRSPSFGVHLTFVQVSAGHFHSCGLTEPGHIYCWGANNYGQLGDGPGESRDAPWPINPRGSAGEVLRFIQVSAGPDHTCAISTEQKAYCWGNNDDGQLGDGTHQDRHYITAVSTAESFDQIAAGGGVREGDAPAPRSFTCGVTVDQDVYCWGANGNGQLGDGTTSERDVPTAAATDQRFAQVSAGGIHSCAVTTGGEAYCWGLNDDSQLGDGTTIIRLVPTAVSTSESFTQLSAGHYHTCGVTTNDQAFCWGNNGAGQLGDGTTIDRSTPALVAWGEIPFQQVSVGAEGLSIITHTCGRVAGTANVMCWGDNDKGQLGNGTMDGSQLPSGLRGGFEGFVQVSNGALHTCGVAEAGQAFCWGYNASGQLGDGTTTDRLTPSAVAQ